MLITYTRTKEGVYLEELPLANEILITTKEYKKYSIEEYYRIIKSDVIEIPEIVFEKITGSKNITYENTYKLVKKTLQRLFGSYYLITNEKFPLCLSTRSLTTNEHQWWHIYFEHKDKPELLEWLLKVLNIPLVEGIHYGNRVGIYDRAYLDGNKIIVPRTATQVLNTDWKLIERFNMFLQEVNIPYELLIASERVFKEQYEHLIKPPSEEVWLPIYNNVDYTADTRPAIRSRDQFQSAGYSMLYDSVHNRPVREQPTQEEGLENPLYGESPLIRQAQLTFGTTAVPWIPGRGGTYVTYLPSEATRQFDAGELFGDDYF